MARPTPLTCSGHTRPVVDLSFSPVTPDGYFLISSCKDGLPMLREGKTGDWVGTFKGHKGAIWVARLNDTATLALTGSADFTAKLFDAVTGDELHSFAHDHIVRAAAFSHDSTHIVTAVKQSVRLYDLALPTAAPTVLENVASKAIKVLLWPSKDDENVILTGSDDGKIRLFDVRTPTNTPIATLESPAKGEIRSVELSRSFLTVADGSRSVAFWDLKSRSLVKQVECDTDVYSASLHPDHQRFVVGGKDCHLHVYSFDSAQPIEKAYKGHHGPVHCVRYAPDGELYASGSEDGTVRLWQTNIGTEYGLWKAVDPK